MTDTTTIQKRNIELTNTETQEIEKVFSEARDFRSVGEKITAPLDNIISETAVIIDKDPIMNVSGELEKMNNEVQGVYKDIIDNDSGVMKFFKGIPLIGSLATSIDSKIDETKFNLKTLTGKIDYIFSGFDTSYNSINTSIDMQKKFLDGIEENLGKVIAYKEFINGRIGEFREKLEAETDENEKGRLALFIQNVEFFQNNLIVLIGNLEMAKKRLEMRLDSAVKLSLAMNSSRPIFKTLLSTAIIETSSQKAIDASLKAMDIMGKTIDNMSRDLTDKAIESSKKAEQAAAKPVLSNQVFLENVTKLKNHFEEIDEFRAQVSKEALEERKLFDEAKTKLDNMKVMNKNDVNLLDETLVK